MEAFTWQKANSVEKGGRQSMNVAQEARRTRDMKSLRSNPGHHTGSGGGGGAGH